MDPIARCNGEERIVFSYVMTATFRRYSLVRLILIVSQVGGIAKAQEFTPSSIKLNPFKICIGFVNFGYERELRENVSLAMFSELMLRREFKVRGLEHPKFCTQLGMRRFFSKERHISGLFLGVFSGGTIQELGTKQAEGFILGLEGGYKKRFGAKNKFFVEPRVLAHYNTGSSGLRIGLEVHLGFRFCSHSIPCPPIRW